MIDKIILDADIKNQEEMFKFIAKEFYKAGFVESESAFIDALKSREKQSTTGLIDGIAIPHGKSDKVSKNAVMYIKNKRGIEWNSLDDRKVHYIFALSIKPGESEQLDKLSKISTILLKKEQRKELKNLTDKEKIKEIFSY